MNAQTATGRLTMAAATVGYFDPLTFGLQVASGDEHTEAMNEIAEYCGEVEVDGAWFWTFEPDARRDALKALAETATRKQLLEDIYGDLHDKDSLGRYLIPAMLGDDLQKRAEAGSRDPALLLATRLAVDSGVGNQEQLEQAGRTVMRSMERTEADQVLATVRPETLVGRNQEYDLLLQFLREDISQNPLEVLTIDGVDGVGKSALVSTFVHNQRRRPHWPPVIHLDFDRTALANGFGQTLTAELTHQIGLFDNDLGESMAQLRARFDGSVKSSYEAGAPVSNSMLAELKQRLSDWEHRNRPLVIVLDTFDEVVLRGPSAAKAVLEWLQQLRDVVGLSNLRPIIAGREVPRSAIASARLAIWHEQRLEDLAVEDSIDLLMSLGTGPSQSARAVAVFGGNPLVLRMFNRFRAENHTTEVDQLLLEAEAERAAGGDSDEPGPRGPKAVSFLTDRILNRLSDDLRAIASFGLLLRTVDRDLIRDVLAKPCGLDEVDDQQADMLLERLAGHGWLIRPGIDGEVRHRRDIRRMTLPRILSLDSQLTDAIHRNAVTFYTTGAGSSTPESGTEADYHRGFLLDQSQLQEQWVTPAPLLLAAIGADIQDWPTPARALLRSQAEAFETLSVAETESLTGEHLSKARKVSVQQSLTYGDIGHARGVADRIKIAPGEFDASSLSLDFAQYEFERVAERGDEALRWYVDTGLDESKAGVWSDPSLHEHMPWLVGLSALAAGDQFRFSEELLSSIHRRHAASDASTSATLLALAVAQLVGDTRASLSLVSMLSSHYHISMSQPRIEAQIHLMQLCVQAPGGDRTLAATTVDRLSTLAPLRRSALGTVLQTMRLNERDSARLANIVNADEARRSQASLTELDDTIRSLQQISVPLHSGAALVGLSTNLTQLHRTCRVLLTDADPEWLTARLEQLSEDLRWPTELSADTIGDQVKRHATSRLLASVVETADRLGLLSTLLDPSNGAPESVARMARLIGRFEEALGQRNENVQATVVAGA
jgi:hypothetical protein